MAISSSMSGRLQSLGKNFSARNIKGFSIDGKAVDGETIIRIRKQIEDHIVDDMRNRGYVPVIDIMPSLYWEYDKDHEQFSYTLTVYGIYVGKRKSKEILGILDHRPIYIEHDRKGESHGRVL